ncbi:hypothetical protein N825_37120 [Skermanella stibiiresistens SB22]|uniref:Uncharacterized protein n=1 Tax=Skermanella stibiiresistens SB22 TaxID=1385369 RepID=W9H2I5_9PROT|nr:hypothetical protein N825_37120 [Skermanella stibiiresistens SB22]
MINKDARPEPRRLRAFDESWKHWSPKRLAAKS